MAKASQAEMVALLQDYQDRLAKAEREGARRFDEAVERSR